MKLKKLTALVSAVSMIGSVFAALPITAGAATQTIKLLEHKMDSEDAVNAVKDGYSDLITPTGDSSVFTAGTAGGSCMNVADRNGRYTSAGIKYEITDLVEGKSGKLTVSADVRGEWGSNLNGKIGFVNDTELAAGSGFLSNYTAQTLDGTSGGFTTISYTADAIPQYTDSLYFFITDGNPTLNVKNVVLTLETEVADTQPEEPPISDDTPVTDDIVIDGTTDIYIDALGADYDGISLIAEAFANDVYLVTGQTPEIVTDSASVSGTAVIAGTVGDANIQALVSAGKIDVSDITGKSEVYKMQYVEAPMAGVDKAVVVAGSDKRGTIYGIFSISELMGVSPWVYWGDALPQQRSSVGLSAAELNVTSKEPSVRFRGIFLNDEAPNLTTWAYDNFGGYNHTFYQHVFELILRLKGNYLWPAMWSNEFNDEGVDGLTPEQAEGFDTLENARLADKYGVVMGTSHHEPMFRAGNEWGQYYRNYLNDTDVSKGAAATWNYFDYAYALDKFWEDGFTRNMEFEGVNTIGMRGEADSALAGGLATNIKNLENVISSQLDIMEKHGKSDMPTMLALYKEVEEYWYGGEENGEHIPGLKEWTVDGKNPLDDTIIMLCDDNFGNLRAVPQADEIDRVGGWGLYYHFDYNGAPISYRWVSSTPLEKVWENMTRAYEYKIDDLWIVNVGDLKPHEMEISYFLDLAYDYEKWSPENIVDDYAKQWTDQQFGYGVDEETVNEIAELQLDYMKLNGTRRAEIVYSSTYSIENSNELNRYIALAEDIYNRAYAIYDKIPDRLKDAYYQIVLYQAAGSANVNLMNMYSALNAMYAGAGSTYANKYAALVKECLARDAEMTEHYNKVMAGGKWDGIMQLTDDLGHYNCTDWTLGEWTAPSAVYVTPESEASLIVNVDGSRTAAKAGGTASLPTFTSTNKEAYGITVSNGGKNKFDYTAEASDDWITLTKTSGTIYSGDRIGVSIDWNKVTSDSTGTVTIAGAGSTVTVNVTADVVDTAGLSDMTFVGKNGITAIEAEHYAAKNGEWLTVENYGKSLSTIKSKPYNKDFTIDDAQYVEYKVYAETAGDYTLRVFATPSNPTTTSGDVRYAVGVNGGAAVEYSSLDDGFLAGDHGTRWGNGVLVNIHTDDTTVTLNAGENTVRIYQISSGFSLQKIALAAPGVSFGNEYSGPEESWYVGAASEQKALVSHSAEDTMTIPGVIADKDKKVIVAADGNYTIAVVGGTVLTADSVKLNGASIDPIENPDGTLEAALKQGEYTIEYTGEGAIEFTLLENTPGVIINHSMSTEAEFSAAAAGYVNRVDGNDDKRVVAFENGAMNYTTTGLYNSSGFKYNISTRVARAIAEYGPDTEFTLTMDLMGDVGDESSNARMAITQGGKELVSVPITDMKKDSFTTYTCKTTFDSTDDIWFFVYTSKPTVYAKNISVTFPAPKSVELFTHDGSGDWDAYEVYDASNTEAVITRGSDLGVSFGSNYGYNSSNGIKIDVTDHVKQCDNGGEFSAELDFTCWYWGGYIEIFLEDQDGGNRVTLAKETTDTENPPENNTIVVSGAANYAYSSNTKTYLCITQHSGNHRYNKITFSGTQTPGGTGDEPAVTPTPDDPSDKNVLFTHTGAADWAAYTVYDETNANGTITAGDALTAKYDSSWNASNGIKIDITDYVSGMSRIGASADANCWWNENKVKLFLETSGGTKTMLGEALDATNNVTVAVSGEADIAIADGERVYLCLTHYCGDHWYDNITLWGYAGGDDPVTTPGPDQTDEPDEPIEPDTRVVIFSEDFADESGAARYSANIDGSLDTAEENGIKWGRLAYNFADGVNAENGMKADITDIVRDNGITTLNASIDVLSYWWGGNTAVFKAVVTGADGTVKNTYQLDSDLAGVDGAYVTLSGSADISYEDDDKIYLVTTHHSGMHQYDNIMIWVDGADIPANTELVLTSPVLDDTGAYITASNGSDNDASFTVYAVSYNADGTLASLKLTPAAVQSGAEDVKITIDAAEGDTIFVWDALMRPLMDKTELVMHAWVAGWGSAQQEYMEGDLPSTPLSGAVIRQVIRMSTGGDYMKVTLSNYYGNGDLVIDSVHIADSLDGGMIDLATDTALTFGGSESVTIPAGEKVESDVVCYSVDDLESIAMTIKTSEVPEKVTGHSGARTTTYIKSRATVSDTSMIGAETNEHWYFASEIDVLRDSEYAVVACLGDSITDGRGCTTNANDRWTDVLMERMKENGMKLTVVNDGIGGNSINNWGLGESGRDRYEKEVKDRTGVKYLIVLEGINDIGGKTEDVFTGDMSKCPEDGKITTGVIEAYQEIIAKAHEQGIRVIGGTILPCGNNDYYNEVSEEMRQTINTWIRESGEFDAVIDFDAVMRDESDPTKLKAEYDSGDGLHPGPAGYKAMGECIDLALFD